MQTFKFPEPTDHELHIKMHKEILAKCSASDFFNFGFLDQHKTVTTSSVAGRVQIIQDVFEALEHSLNCECGAEAVLTNSKSALVAHSSWCPKAESKGQ